MVTTQETPKECLPMSGTGGDNRHLPDKPLTQWLPSKPHACYSWTIKQ